MWPTYATALLHTGSPPSEPVRVYSPAAIACALPFGSPATTNWSPLPAQPLAVASWWECKLRMQTSRDFILVASVGAVSLQRCVLLTFDFNVYPVWQIVIQVKCDFAFGVVISV